MSKPYYIDEDLKKFGEITEWQKELGEKLIKENNK